MSCLINLDCNLNETRQTIQPLYSQNERNTKIDIRFIQDNDSQFLNSVKSLKSIPQSTQTSKDTLEPYITLLRTRWIIAWIISNALLIIIMTSEFLRALNTPTTNSSILLPHYLKFIFYSVLGLTSIRFIGSILFAGQRLVCG